MNILWDNLSVNDLEVDNYTNVRSGLEARGVKIDEPNDFSKMLTPRFFVYCSIIVLGIVLNLVVVIVYVRKLQKSTYIFLFCLAVVDLFNCLFIICDILKSADILPKLTTRAFCFAHAYLVDTGCFISAGVVFLLALDRFLKSKFLKHSLSRSQCLVLILTVFLSATIVTLPFLVSWTAKLLTLNERERKLMCGQRHSYDHFKVHYSETGFSGPRLFLLVSNSVSVILLLCAFLAIFILYVKMTLQIRRKSFINRQKVSPLQVNKEPVKFQYSEAIRNDVIVDISAENSDVSNSDIEDVPETSTERLDKNGNKKHRTSRDNYSSKDSIVGRRKSSILSIPSKVLSVRYYCLIVFSILIFLFYLIHFLSHIVNIVRFETQPNNGIRYVLYDCLRHSYIVCFILNPIIYSYFNRGFFRNFKKSFCCDKAQNQNMNRISASSIV